MEKLSYTQNINFWYFVIMTQYSLKLPPKLQQEAEKYATDQGITLDNLIIWAISKRSLLIKFLNLSIMSKLKLHLDSLYYLG